MAAGRWSQERRWPATVGLALLLAVVLVPAAHATGSPESAPPSHVEGRVAAMASSIAATEDGPIGAPSVSILLHLDDGSLLSVTLAPDAGVTDEHGRAIQPGTIPLGARVRATGEATGPGRFLATEVSLLP